MKEEEDLGLESTVCESDIEDCLTKAKEVEVKLKELKENPKEYFIYSPPVEEEKHKVIE